MSVLKLWNPDWEPNFFLTDYSNAEIGAINKLFPLTQVYICEFHREQAWEWWVKDREHSLTSYRASVVLDKLRDCANVPPNYSDSDKPVDYHYLAAVKETKVWKTVMMYSNGLITIGFPTQRYTCIVDIAQHLSIIKYGST